MEILSDELLLVKRKRNTRNVGATSDNITSAKRIKFNEKILKNKFINDIADTSINNIISSQLVENNEQKSVANAIDALSKKSNDIPYSDDEDKKIIGFFQKNMDWSNLNFDDELYRKCLADTSLQRTINSVKNRFLNYILPNLHKFSMLSVEEMLLFYDRAGVDFPPEFEQYVNSSSEIKEQEITDFEKLISKNTIGKNKDNFHDFSTQTSFDLPEPQFSHRIKEWDTFSKEIENKICSNKNIYINKENLNKNVELFNNKLKIFEDRFAKFIKSRLKKSKMCQHIKLSKSFENNISDSKIEFTCTCRKKNFNFEDSESAPVSPNIDDANKPIDNNANSAKGKNSDFISTPKSNVSADSEFSSPIIPQFTRNVNVIDINKLMCREIEMCSASNVIINNHCNVEPQPIDESLLDSKINIPKEDNFNSVDEFKADLEMESIKTEILEENNFCSCKFTEQEICNYCSNNGNYQPFQIKLEFFKDEYVPANSSENVYSSSKNEQENRNERTTDKNNITSEIQDDMNILSENIDIQEDKDLISMEICKIVESVEIPTNSSINNEQNINQNNNETQINSEIQSKNESAVIATKNYCNCEEEISNKIKIAETQPNEDQELVSLFKIDCTCNATLEEIQKENSTATLVVHPEDVDKVYLIHKLSKKNSAESNLVRKPAKFTYTNKKRKKEMNNDEMISCTLSKHMTRNKVLEYKKNCKLNWTRDNQRENEKNQQNTRQLNLKMNDKQELAKLSVIPIETGQETNDINSKIIDDSNETNIDVTLNSSREILPISFSNYEGMEEGIPGLENEIRLSSNEISVLKFKRKQQEDSDLKQSRKVVITYLNHKICSIKVLDEDKI